MKKGKNNLIVAMLILLTAFIITPIVRLEAKTFTYDDFTYSVHNDNEGNSYVILESYNGRSEEVILPEEIDSMKVISMMKSYKYPSAIKKIVLSKNIRAVSELEFKNLESLKEIRVDKGNPYYKSENGILFEDTGNRIHLIFYPRAKKGNTYTIPSKVDVATGAFVNNNNLKKLILNNKLVSTDGIAQGSNIETVIISDSIRFIGEATFLNCKKLKNVVMGKNVTVIGEEAFRGCSSLTKINLPSKLEKIENWSFKDCKSLKFIQIPNSVYKIAFDAFDGCNAKIKKAVYLKKQKDGSYIAKADVIVNKKGKKKQYKICNFTQIRPSEKNIILKKGKSKKIKTEVYVLGKKKGILDNSILKYTVSNKKVIKITGKGKITALKKGNATIKVELKMRKLSYKVKVKVK